MAMAEKTKREKKERSQRARMGVNLVYNRETQRFVDKMRAKYNIRLPFAYDYRKDQAEETPQALVEDISRFVDEAWEPTSEAERRYLDKSDPFGKARSIKKELRKIGFFALLTGIFVPKKLVKALTGKEKDPVKEINDYRERSLLPIY
jgi:hypothetical protein